MSSQEVRTAIIDAITPLVAPWPVFNVSDYQDIEEILLGINAQTVLVQFVVANETQQNIAGEGNQGWEEDGSTVIHLIVPTGFDSTPVIVKGEEIQKGMRGKRLPNGVTIETMSPFVDFSGSIGVDGAVHGFASSLFYNRRDCG
jgi:hypothetical protein